ncbi:hypothetical protein HHI36_009400 [Cryptolaemus montrouzieri]|uniref:PiggyBac transposable element-derived protein domain-containing protein n=1 Tax=Cryptolaemus montrouzieri TaxID=559131 RepID=A0ABD2MW21_9CUCU
MSRCTKKIFANLMPEDEEADKVLIIPQQNASSDVESDFEDDNEDEYAPFGLLSEFEAPNSGNSQTLLKVEFEENFDIESPTLENEDPNDQENDDEIYISSNKDEYADENLSLNIPERSAKNLNVNPNENKRLKGANRQKWNSIGRAKGFIHFRVSPHKNALTAPTELLQPIDHLEIFFDESIFMLQETNRYSGNNQ